MKAQFLLLQVLKADVDAEIQFRKLMSPEELEEAEFQKVCDKTCPKHWTSSLNRRDECRKLYDIKLEMIAEKDFGIQVCNSILYKRQSVQSAKDARVKALVGALGTLDDHPCGATLLSQSLVCASADGLQETVELLLQSKTKIDVNFSFLIEPLNGWKLSALAAAVYSKNDELAKVLMTRDDIKLFPDQKYENSALEWTIHRYRGEIMPLLLSKFGDEIDEDKRNVALKDAEKYFSEFTGEIKRIIDTHAEAEETYAEAEETYAEAEETYAEAKARYDEAKARYVDGIQRLGPVWKNSKKNRSQMMTFEVKKDKNTKLRV